MPKQTSTSLDTRLYIRVSSKVVERYKEAASALGISSAEMIRLVLEAADPDLEALVGSYKLIKEGHAVKSVRLLAEQAAKTVEEAMQAARMREETQQACSHVWVPSLDQREMRCDKCGLEMVAKVG